MATTFNLFDVYRKTLADTTRAAAISGTLKCAILTATTIGTGASGEQNTWQYFSSCSANEVTGTGYTAKGNACATPGWTMGTTGIITYTASNPATWSQNAAGFSAGRRAILYFDTGTNSTSTLLGFSDDFGADLGNVAADFSVAINASGIYTCTR